MEKTATAAWHECLDIIRDNITRQSFKTWFSPIKSLNLEEENGLIKLTVQLPSRFYYEWLEEHYYALLRKTVTHVLGPKARLYYEIVVEKDPPESRHSDGTMQIPARVPTERPEEPDSPSDSPEKDGDSDASYIKSTGAPPVTNPFIIPGIQKVQIDSKLNPTYTFDRFIEGDCNRLARSASWAIAQNPGKTSFNPFMIYGGVGLGKTHLVQAVGNYVKSFHTDATVLYVSSERFTTEFVQSIQHNRVSEFSMFYRQIDLLIVDDVQFFGGKEKTQEEFFHIFNTLHQAGKQIILSADRPPKDIEGIEERLLSRFQWGLTADVKSPDLETRIAILQRKAEDDGIDISPDVITFIAHNIKSNIRELEGSLIRLLAHATLRQAEISLPFAREVLKDLIKESRISLTIEEIQRITCQYFNIPEDQVRAKTRKQEVVQARQVAMYFCKKYTNHSLKTIGLHFGGRDHTTVIHAIKNVEDFVEVDPKYREMVEEIRNKIELQSR